MTIRELYKWAIENEVEDATVKIIFCKGYETNEIKFNPMLKRKSVDSDGNVTVEIFMV